VFTQYGVRRCQVDRRPPLHAEVKPQAVAHAPARRPRALPPAWPSAPRPNAHARTSRPRSARIRSGATTRRNLCLHRRPRHHAGSCARSRAEGGCTRSAKRHHHAPPPCMAVRGHRRTATHAQAEPKAGAPAQRHGTPRTSARMAVHGHSRTPTHAQPEPEAGAPAQRNGTTQPLPAWGSASTPEGCAMGCTQALRSVRPGTSSRAWHPAAAPGSTRCAGWTALLGVGRVPGVFGEWRIS
jgi:hypothetical protein